MNQRSPVKRALTRVHLIVSALFVLGVVSQVTFAGLAVLVGPQYWPWHVLSGHVLSALAFTLPLWSLLAGQRGWALGLSVLAALLLVMQYVSLYQLGGLLPAAKALHALDALFAFWTGLQLVTQDLRLLRRPAPSSGVLA